MVYKRLEIKRSRGLLHALSLWHSLPQRSQLPHDKTLGEDSREFSEQGGSKPSCHQGKIDWPGKEVRIREVGGKERMSGEL